MPRYFFDIHDGPHKAHDDIGVDCANVHAASVQATIALTELARDLLPGDGPDHHLAIMVRSETEPLFSVQLDFATLPAHVKPQ